MNFPEIMMKMAIDLKAGRFQEPRRYAAGFGFYRPVYPAKCGGLPRHKFLENKYFTKLFHPSRVRFNLDNKDGRCYFSCMFSETRQLAGKFIRNDFHIVLTLSVFVYLFSLIGHTLFPIFSQEVIMLFIAVFNAFLFLSKEYPFLTALIKDLRKIPTLVHYAFFFITLSAWLFIKLDLLKKFQYLLSRTKSIMQKYE